MDSEKDIEFDMNYDIHYESDQNDDEDNWYYFGDKLSDEEELYPDVNDETILYRAVVNGDLDTIQMKLEQMNFCIDEALKKESDSLPILHIACREAHLALIKYLVLVRKADVNKFGHSSTPLICLLNNMSRKEDGNLLEIVDFLLLQGADSKLADIYGITALMYACRFGYLNVISKLLPLADLNVLDNQGYTALHYAIENHNVKAVLLLLDAGCDHKQLNKMGFTPLQFAEINGCADIVQILPKDQQQFLLPTTHNGYFTLADYIPSIHSANESKRPEYFPEIHLLLSIYNLENLLEYFYQAQITLKQFLCMRDNDLLAIRIEMPLHRQYLEKALLDFHLHHWTMDSIARIKPFNYSNFNQILMLLGNHLQNLIITQASLQYVCTNLNLKYFGSLNTQDIERMLHLLNYYQQTIKKTSKTVKCLCQLSPSQPPLYINYEHYLRKQRRQRFSNCYKYSLLAIGFTIYFTFKLKKYF